MTFSKKLVCLHTYLSVQVSSVFCPPPLLPIYPFFLLFSSSTCNLPLFCSCVFLHRSFLFIFPPHILYTRTFFSSTSSLIASGLCSFSLSHLPNILSFHSRSTPFSPVFVFFLGSFSSFFFSIFYHILLCSLLPPPSFFTTTSDCLL
jgi:hypothetical protein